MNRRNFIFGLALLTAGSCGSSGPSLERTTLSGGLEVGVPTGWSLRDFSSLEHTTLQATPSSDDNEHGESLLVTRAYRPAQATAPIARIGRWLVDAQRKLPQAAFGHPTPLVTKNGFSGVRVEGEFVPPNKDTAYRRLHAVVVDRDSLVNVIYTAKQLDRERFDAIVDSLSREGQ